MTRILLFRPRFFHGFCFFFLLVDFSTLDMNWYSGLTIGCSLIVGGKQWVPKLTRSFRPLYQLFLTSIQSSLHLCVHPSLCKSIHCVFLSIHSLHLLYVSIQLFLFINLSVCPSIHPSISFYLSIICPSIHCIFPSIHHPSVPPSLRLLQPSASLLVKCHDLNTVWDANLNYLNWNNFTGTEIKWPGVITLYRV